MPDATIPALRSFLVSRYADLKRTLTRRLGCADLAGDALQDTWLKLESRDDAEGVREPFAYLLRTAVNVAYDRQRNQSRLVSASEIEALLAEQPDPAPEPPDALTARRELDTLMAAIGKLPERRRQILVMVRWEHVPQREVAERLGVSLRTVEQELKKAHDFCAARVGRTRQEK
ncbi:RNA polymerase sigma factor [Pigmentiphaga sp. YJ18]|uniref:RNA polymerase sigma factor n=1 Tax=Pigmentiphaga sp. YJ18 TaxID=3134907 RepID=UPI0009674893|nr:RNA polymerase sigma factor [Burkholderiales bacterium]OJW95016.1 MAG: RNA polymerase subunit sigma-70 [Burkholderiales bacterium 67-32]